MALTDQITELIEPAVSAQGFFLEEVKNVEINWINDQGELDDVAEPGFAAWRFEPAQPLRKKKIVRIEIFPQVDEILYIPEKKKSKEKSSKY